MNEQEWLARQFEEQRPHLRAVAYRMLGSLSEAEDAVQDAWLRVGRADTTEVENLRAWLTTIVARVSLNMLRTRGTRREGPLDVHLPDPIIDPADGTDPEHEALLADSVGLALLVVLEMLLMPAERMAFVLHDMFAVPFEDIAPILERSPEATRQLASRARRRVRGADPVPDPDLTAQWEVVEAFLAAARGGDFDALVAVLDPDVELADGGLTGISHHIRGAANVAGQALMFVRRPDHSPRARERRRRDGLVPRRRAVLALRNDDQERQDCQAGLPDRPRAARAPRPHRARGPAGGTVTASACAERRGAGGRTRRREIHAGWTGEPDRRGVGGTPSEGVVSTSAGPAVVEALAEAAGRRVPVRILSLPRAGRHAGSIWTSTAAGSTWGRRHAGTSTIAALLRPSGSPS